MFKTIFREPRLYAVIALFMAVFSLMVVGFIGTLAADSNNSSYRMSPLSYDIQAIWDEHTHTLQASAEVTIKNAYPDTLSELVFHWHADSTSTLDTQTLQAKKVGEKWRQSLLTAGRLEQLADSDWLGGVTTNYVTTEKGDKLEYNHQGQALTVQLPKPLKPGDSTTLRVRYDVKYPYGANPIMRSESLTGGTWWTPQLAVYDPKYGGWNRIPYDANYRSEFYSMADYHVKLELPASWNVITNGDTKIATTNKGTQVVTATSHSLRELVWYGGDIEQIATSVMDDGLVIKLHRLQSTAARADGLAPLSQAESDLLLQRITAAANWMSSHIGRLPYAELQWIESPYTGMSHSADGMILFSRNADGTIDESSIYRNLAKQWMQHAISSNPQQDGFIATGLSEFIAAYYQETVVQKPWSTSDIMYLLPQRLPAAAPSLKLGAEADHHYRLFGVHALRKWTTDFGYAAFDQAIKQFYDTYKGKMASTNGFINIVEQVNGEAAGESLRRLLK